MSTLSKTTLIQQANQVPQKIEPVSEVNNTTVAVRDRVFETLLSDNWRESIPTRVGKFSDESRRWIAELKTRFLTNPNLTPEKTAALIDLVLWYESKVLIGAEMKGDPSENRPSIGNIYNGIALGKLRDFLHIQIYTREVEKHIAKMEGNNFLSHGYVADFLRDIHTLESLGLRAPQIREILAVIEKHPELQFDEAILAKYRAAVQKALNAHYWQLPELATIPTNPNTNITVPAQKGETPVPITRYEEGGSDDHARDFTLTMYPPSIIEAMSTFNRRVIYDLTRTSPPVVKKKGFFASKTQIFSRKRSPDFTRITIEQDSRLRQMISSKD